MSPGPLFSLTAQPDGRKELRIHAAAADDVVLALSEREGREFGVALADVLTALDAGVARAPIELYLDGCLVRISGTAESGIRL